jgi:hypothetical protein
MTFMTAMTMNYRGSLKGMCSSLLRRETVLGAGSLRSQGRQRAMQIRSSERLPLPEHLLLLA